MLKLGIVGTNWITDQFIAAANESGCYMLHSVYSRKLETAKKFGEKYEKEIRYFNQMEDFLSDEELEVVYIASPNGLHFEQTKEVLNHKKHAIVEKPAFSTPFEFAQITVLAKANGVFFFEAIRNLHDESFSLIQEFVCSKEVWGASFNYAKYSSRMDRVLNDEVPNIFSLKFSGGALMDLGVYLVYPAIALFGVPREVHYFPTLLKTGVDGQGMAILDYGEFKVTLEVGKMNDSFAPSQVYFSDGTLVIDDIANLEGACLHSRKGESQELKLIPKENGMSDEASVFAKIIEKNDTEKFGELTLLAKQVNQVMYDLRKSAGIRFASDGE